MLESVVGSEPETSLASIPEDAIIILANGRRAVTLPASCALFEACLSRAGSGLRIDGGDGSNLLIADYFAADRPADLLGAEGHQMSGRLVAARLAGEPALDAATRDLLMLVAAEGQPAAAADAIDAGPAVITSAAESVSDDAPPSLDASATSPPPADTTATADDPPSLEMSAGGDEGALTGDLIAVTQPTASFDLKPQSVSAAGAEFAPVTVGGNPYALTVHDREYLFFTEPRSRPGEEDVGLPPQSPRPMFWDGGRRWNILGSWDESSGQIPELPLGAAGRITTRDGFAAKLDARGATVSQITRLLETNIDDLTMPGGTAPLAASRSPVAGSAMRVAEPFFLTTGSVVRFDVFFDGVSDAINEYAVMTASTAGKTIVAPLRSEADLVGRGGSGWLTVEYTAGVTGSYWFGFASLADHEDGRARLLVDNVRFDRAASHTLEAVPAYGSEGYADDLGGRTMLYRPLPRLIEPNLSVSLGAGETAVIAPLRNVEDPDPFDAPTITLDRAGVAGTVALLGNGEIAYTPGIAYRQLGAGKTGSDSFGYIVDGGNGAAVAGRVTLSMTGINDAPEAADDRVTTREDEAISGNVLLGDRFGTGRDVDIDGDALTASLLSGPRHGTLQFSASGTFTYVPHSDYFGSDTFSYRLSDGALFDEATVTIIIEPVNDPPHPLPDRAVTDQNTAIAIDVLANDRDPDPGDVLSITGNPSILATSGAGPGKPEVRGEAGRIRLDPAHAFDRLAVGETGSLTIRYEVGDVSGATAASEVLVEVRGLNDAPIAGSAAAAVGEADTTSAITVRGAIDDIDSDDDPMSLRVVAVGSVWGQGAALGEGGIILFEANAVRALDTLREGDVRTFADAIRFVVEDRHGAQATGTVTLTVTGANDPIVAADDEFRVGEDGPATLAPLANDSDPDEGDTARILAIDGVAVQPGSTVTLASGALLRINSDTTIRYDPNGRFEWLASGKTETDTFSYAVADGAGAIADARVLVTIEGANDPPIAAADTAVTDADAAVRIAVLANDRDPDTGDRLTIRSVVAGSAQIDGGPTVDLSFIGDVRINADGTLTYDPQGRFDQLADGETRTVSFRHVVEDSFGGRSTATVTVVVHGVADPHPRRQELISSFDVVDPLIENSTFPGWGEEPQPGGDERDVARYGTFSGDFAGFAPTHLGYVARISGRSGSRPEIEEALHVPSGSLPRDSDGTLANRGAAMSTTISLVADDRGADGGMTLSFDWNFLPSAADNVAATGINDYAIFSVSNGWGGAEATQWHVFQLADARLLADLGKNPGTATGWRTSVFDITGTFSLPATGDLFLTTGFAVVNDQTPDNPSTLLIDNVRLNRVLGPDFIADLTYGGSGANRLPTFRQDPTAIGDAISIDWNGAPIRETAVVSISAAQLLANDFPSRGTASVRMTAIDGTDTTGRVTLAADGTFVQYDATGRFSHLAEGETAVDSFRYRIADANGGSDWATAAVTVLGVNDPPEAANDTVRGSEDRLLIGSVLADNGDGADRDVDGDALTVSLALGPRHGTVQLSIDGTFSYAPDADFHGLDSFIYRLSDGRLTDEGQVTVEITPVNDPPVAANDPATTTEDDRVVIPVIANDTDVDIGDVLRPIRVAGLPIAVGAEIALLSGAAVGLRADGALVYDPRDAFAGLREGQSASDTFTYTVGDGSDGEDTATVTVAISGMNDVPMAVFDRVETDARSPVSIPAATLLANDVDPDVGDTLRLLTVAGDGTTGAVSFDGTTVTYDPAGQFTALRQGQSAVEVLRYTIADQAGATAIGDIRIVVAGVNDTPVAVDDAATTREGRPVIIDVLGNDFDPDLGDTLSIAALDTTGTRGTVSLTADGRVSYQPGTAFDALAPGETGVDVFRYTVEDGYGGSDTAEVRITVVGRSNVERIVESFESPIQPLNISFGSSSVVSSVAQHQETDGGRGLYLPTDGAAMARIEAFGTTRPNLDQFLGTPLLNAFRDPADQSVPAQGAALRFSVNLQVGDELSFDWMFDARDAVGQPSDGFSDNDFALFTVTGATGTSAFKLSDVRSVGDFGASGWRSSVYRAEASEAVTIGFAVVNDRRSDLPLTSDANSQNSMLLVDNVRVNRDFGEGYQVVDIQLDGRFETLAYS